MCSGLFNLHVGSFSNVNLDIPVWFLFVWFDTYSEVCGSSEEKREKTGKKKSDQEKRKCRLFDKIKRNQAAVEKLPHGKFLPDFCNSKICKKKNKGKRQTKYSCQ